MRTWRAFIIERDPIFPSIANDYTDPSAYSFACQFEGTETSAPKACQEARRTARHISSAEILHLPDLDDDDYTSVILWAQQYFLENPDHTLVVIYHLVSIPVPTPEPHLHRRQDRGCSI